MDNSLDISVRIGSQDCDLMLLIINQGIDSRLEGFTKSQFSPELGRLFISIHPEEVQVFLRRLWELHENTFNENAYDWEDSILEYYYGFIPPWG